MSREPGRRSTVRRSLDQTVLLLLVLLTFAHSIFVQSQTVQYTYDSLNLNAPWVLVWADEFNGAAHTGVNTHDWLYDIGTKYPGGPDQWGTGEVETMSSDTANVYQDGSHLVIKPLHSGGSPLSGWTSGRIETQRVFQAPANGALAIEARIQQPNVSAAAAAGYWPAFWMLGDSFRGNYRNWPGIGEIDIMEDVNGLSSVFATFHCGSSPGGPCNEFTGISSGQVACPGCQTAFHTYRVELDESIAPQQIRWYLDGVNFFTVNSTQVDAATWTNATHHGFFVILDVAIGGSFPGAFGGTPTSSTASGIPMVVDYVRVYTSPTATAAPQIDAQPTDQAASPGQNASFSIAASGAPAPTYQWQSSRTLRTSWTDLANDAQYGGVTSTTLTVTGVTAALNSYRYRAVATNSAGTAMSNVATLTVNGAPTGRDRRIAPGDFDGDGNSDIAIFRPSTGVWYLRGIDTITWGGGGDIPVEGDYDGDGKSDIAVFRPSSGVWYLRGIDTVTWGGGGDIPVVGDYDGDAKSDIAIFRPSTSIWYIRNISTAIWGGGGDIPVVGDYDGDGKSDIAVFRPSTGVWYVRGISTTTWGGGGDIPVAGDYDGDGKTDIGVFRPSTGVWYIRDISTVPYGGGGDIPVPGDYDGDGKTDIAIFRPSTGAWFVTTLGAAVTWGGSGDIPILKRP